MRDCASVGEVKSAARSATAGVPPFSERDAKAFSMELDLGLGGGRWSCPVSAEEGAGAAAAAALRNESGEADSEADLEFSRLLLIPFLILVY